MATRKRKKISTTTRFEVFKRDSFKCQYCGRAAPEVVLELEHVHPHSKGGADDMLNLVTSCWDCNNGKSDRLLSDDAVIQRQRAELEQLQMRREQLEMMLRWRQENVESEESAVAMFAKEYSRRVVGWALNENGLQSARTIVRKFGIVRALQALDEAADQVVRFDKHGVATQESLDKIFGAIFVCAEPPDIRRLYRVRGWVRSRWNHVSDSKAIGVLRKLHAAGATVDEIEERTKEIRDRSPSSFNEWFSEMEAWLSELRGF